MVCGYVANDVIADEDVVHMLSFIDTLTSMDENTRSCARFIVALRKSGILCLIEIHALAIVNVDQRDFEVSVGTADGMSNIV